MKRLEQDPKTLKKDPVYILGQIRAAQRWQSIATIVLYLVLAGGAIYVYLLANDIHDSLCTLRGDLQHRVQTTRKFLHDHPEGFAGIPAATLRQSMQGQQRTIKALSSLHCAGTDLPQG